MSSSVPIVVLLRDSSLRKTLEFKNCCSDTFLLSKVQHPVFQTNINGLIIAVWMFTHIPLDNCFPTWYSGQGPKVPTLDDLRSSLWKPVRSDVSLRIFLGKESRWIWMYLIQVYVPYPFTCYYTCFSLYLYHTKHSYLTPVYLHQNNGAFGFPETQDKNQDKDFLRS